jgi:site-specific recombinase XerD
MGRSPRFEKTYAAEVLTEDEVSALLRGCSTRAPTGIRNRALIMVMYRCGLRISEALDLKPSDVNADAGTIRVLDGKGHKPRTVSIDDGALAFVQRWMDVRTQLRRERGWSNGPLFCTLQNGSIHPTYVRVMLKRNAEAAGIEKHVRPHGLRHSHAAELVAEGVPVNVIRDQLGHANLSVTDRYLRNIAPADVIAMGRNRKPWSGEQA